jgi:hypothetical protein
MERRPTRLRLHRRSLFSAMLRETILTSFNVTAMLRPHGGLNHPDALTTLRPGECCCGEGDQQQLNRETAQQFTDDLLIRAHPIRIQVLTMLARGAGQLCRCNLEAVLPLKQLIVSYHLGLLRDAMM